MPATRDVRFGNGSRALVPALALGLGAVALVAATAATGRRRPRDDAPLRASRHDRFAGRAVVGRSILIDRPRHELYAFWRDLQNLPRFMKTVQRIEPVDGGRFRWTIAAPLGSSVALLTEIVEERQDELIGWRSVAGSDIEAWGRVGFRDAPAGRGTVVEAEIAYRPPGGNLGRLLAGLFAAEPDIQGRQELKRFKMLMETGEIATAARRRSETEGEWHARPDLARHQ